MSKLISMSHSAIFIKIAEIIGKGRNLKAPLNKSADIRRVKIAIRNPEVLWVAPEFIFSAVLIKTAVFGSPHKSQTQIFESQSQSTSLSFENFTFVIFSAIFAEIIVSIIAIIATTRETLKSHFAISINSPIFEIEILAKGNWNNSNVISGYLSTKSNICGKYQLSTKSPIQIQTIVNTITDGNFGKYFFQIIKNQSQRLKTRRETILVETICFPTSIKFIKTSLCCGIQSDGSFNHSAPETCHKAMVIQTEIKNQCNAVDGISVIYFVIFKKYTSNIKIHAKIAIRGKRNTPFSQWAKTKPSKIELNAPATQNTL